MLSKSKFTRGINCQKSLWLYVHKKEERVIDDATQSIFAQGTDVGELARQYFPNGKMVLNGVADDFLHIIVIPSENNELLGNCYSFTSDNLETTWRKTIVNQTKFRIIDSRQILQMIENIPDYSGHVDYLKSRYLD